MPRPRSLPVSSEVTPPTPSDTLEKKAVCRKTIKPRRGHRLVLLLDHLDISGRDYFLIQNLQVPNEPVLVYGRHDNNKTFVIEDGFVDISFSITEGRKRGRGFVLRFENIESDQKRQDTSLVAPKTANTNSPLIWRLHQGVKGSIDKCIREKRDKISIGCPSGHVIFQPEVIAGVSNAGKCMYQSGDCTGAPHTLVTQRNKCYWKNSCSLRWTRGTPMTMTDTINCLALIPKYISVRQYQCIPREDVIDICDGRNRFINATSGIIRSHDLYPWHYRTKKKVCRKRFLVNKKHGLRIYTDEIDLDPDTKGDNLKVKQLKGQGRLLKKLRGSQKMDITVKEGCIELEFRVSRRSRGGKGFVLKFETAVNSPDEQLSDDFDDCPPIRRRSRHYNDMPVSKSDETVVLDSSEQALSRTLSGSRGKRKKSRDRKRRRPGTRKRERGNRSGQRKRSRRTKSKGRKRWSPDNIKHWSVATLGDWNIER